MKKILIIRFIATLILFLLGVLSLFFDGSNLVGNLFISSSFLSFFLNDYILNKKSLNRLNKWIIILSLIVSLIMIAVNIILEEDNWQDLLIFPLTSLIIGIAYFIYKLGK